LSLRCPSLDREHGDLYFVFNQVMIKCFIILLLILYLLLKI
jgi:hypothetical protein